MKPDEFFDEDELARAALNNAQIKAEKVAPLEGGGDLVPLIAIMPLETPIVLECRGRLDHIKWDPERPVYERQEQVVVANPDQIVILPPACGHRTGQALMAKDKVTGRFTTRTSPSIHFQLIPDKLKEPLLWTKQQWVANLPRRGGRREPPLLGRRREGDASSPRSSEPGNRRRFESTMRVTQPDLPLPEVDRRDYPAEKAG